LGLVKTNDAIESFFLEASAELGDWAIFDSSLNASTVI